jgi:Ca2+-binding RTX toxin-like protein
LAIVLGLGLQLGSIQQAAAAPAPVGNGFVVTPGDLSFILKQIKIAERHSTTQTASDPCGTLLAQPGDGIPDSEQVPDVITSYGLRTVDGSCNNLKAATGVQAPGQPNGQFAGNPNPSFFGAANQVFPRLTTPSFRDADPITPDFPVGAPGPTTYKSKTGSVLDSEVRVTSNLIDDQTNTNPAAVAAAGHPQRTQTGGKATAVPCTTDPQPTAVPPVDGVPLGCTPSHQTLFIPNVTTDTGLSPPYNSLFTFFGQFFDHGVDQTEKSGGTVFIPLRPDDPLITLGPDGKPNTGDEVSPSQAFMALPRTQDQPGPDGILHTADDVQDADNTDTPWVDQSQTYTSHASHQVFLREFRPNSAAAGDPAPGPDSPAAVATGKLLQGIVNDDPLPCAKPAPFACYNDGNAGTGSLSTWASVRQQAHDLFGMRLEDKDVLNVPLLATDPYGKYLPGPNGLPQYVTKGPDGKAGTADDVLVEGVLDNPATPNIDETVPVPNDVEYFGTPFLTDIAHNADPSPDPQTGVSPQPDANSTIETDFTQQARGTYDDELLATHFTCGDGRCNENIALSSIHQVFHSEHDRLVDYIDNELHTPTADGGAADQLAAWQATGVSGPNGTGSYTYGERLFQAARFVTEMEYQHLVFEEFARKVQPAVRPFHVYSPDINPAIDAEFAHAVYRFGHSMLDDQVARQDQNPDGTRTDNSLPLLKAFLNPPAFFNNSVDPAHPVYTPEQAAGSVLLGSSDQTGNEIDEFVTETLRNNLLGLPLDLPSINMARARDAGVPSLNEVRRQLFAQTNDGQLAPYTSWADFGQHLKHPESLINFVAAYGTHPTVRDSGPDGVLGTNCDHVAPFDATNPAPSAACADNVTTVAAKRAAARAIVDPSPGDPTATPPVPADVQPADAADFMFSTGAWASTPDGVTTTGLDVDPITNSADPRFAPDAEATTGVDLWVGGLAELTNQNGGLLGSTFNYVFQTQLEKLQDGDRLYYLARTPGMNLRTQLEGNSFSELIERNTDYTNSLKADAFATADCKFQLADITTPYSTGAPTAVVGFPAGTTVSMTATPPLTALTGAGTVNDDPVTPCDENQLLLEKPDGTIQYRANNKIDPPGINGQSVYNGSDTAGDRVVGGVDNDTIWGNGGNDVIEGNNGDDIALGGEGDDIITDLNGADVPKGGPGNDAVDGGPGDDIPMGNAGNDFINGGANDNESFAGPGNDFVIAGQGADAVFGDGGDDWIQGGTGQDLLQGDHGAPFFDDPAEKAPGNDIFVGQPGENDYDAEGGDDIMAQNAAIDRNAGAGGFDWAIHQYDTVGGNDDLEINQQLAGLPLPIVVNRDRWQETEADSGSNFNDVIRGDALERIVGGFGFTGCDALDQAGVDRITGLGDYVTTFPTSVADVKAVAAAGDCPLTGVPGAALDGTPGVWAEGNILFGGGGSDVIEGRENQDIIDGDSALNIAIDVHANNDGTGAVLGSTDLMEDKALTGDFGAGTTGMTLQQAVFAGKVDPGQLVASRFIVEPDGSPIGASAARSLAGDCPAATADPATPVDGVVGSTVKLAGTTNCDTAVFSGEPATGAAGYTVQANPDGSVTVTDTASAALIAAGTPFPKGDGIDTLWNVENLRFCIHNDPVTKKCDAFEDHPVSEFTAPAAPLNVTALALNGAALVSWSEPAGANVVSFDVKAFDGSTEVKKVTVPGTDSSTTITGLPNGTALTFRVRANGHGGGTDSAPSAPVTPTAPAATAPDAPSIGTATAAVGGANVTWSAPASDGGAAIQSYKVEVLDSSNAVIKTVTVSAPATSTTVTGLTPNTVVRFRVSAINGVGASVSSTTSNPVTVIGDIIAPTVSNRTPGGATTGVPTRTLVTASFSEPVQGVSGTTFTLRNTVTGKAVSATVTLNPGGTSATLKPNAALASGTQYTATLTGGASAIRDTAGNAMSSTTWSFKTVADKTAPTVTSRAPGSGAKNVPTSANVVIGFSEQVKGVSGSTVTLTNLSSGKKVAATVTLSANGRTVTLNPNAALGKGRQFQVRLTGGISDTANNKLAALTWKFHT